MWPFDLIFFLPTSGYWDNKSVFVPRKLPCKRQVILRCSGANVKIFLSSQQLHLNTEVKKTIFKWWSNINGRMLRNYQNSTQRSSILPSSATFTSELSNQRLLFEKTYWRKIDVQRFHWTSNFLRLSNNDYACAFRWIICYGKHCESKWCVVFCCFFGKFKVSKA